MYRLRCATFQPGVKQLVSGVCFTLLNPPPAHRGHYDNINNKDQGGVPSVSSELNGSESGSRLRLPEAVMDTA